MTNSLKAGLLLLGVIAVVLVIGWSTATAPLGSAPSGVGAAQRIATTTAVGPQEVKTVFASKAQCSSRVISTLDGTNSAIMVVFGTPTNGDVATPTGVIGHYQAGSTTQMYDSGLYGCGAWKIYGYASSTITIAEFN